MAWCTVEILSQPAGKTWTSTFLYDRQFFFYEVFELQLHVTVMTWNASREVKIALYYEASIR